jgi:hypothetical protein
LRCNWLECRRFRFVGKACDMHLLGAYDAPGPLFLAALFASGASFGAGFIGRNGHAASVRQSPCALGAFGDDVASLPPGYAMRLPCIRGKRA